jgi:hypothetical protein
MSDEHGGEMISLRLHGPMPGEDAMGATIITESGSYSVRLNGLPAQAAMMVWGYVNTGWHDLRESRRRQDAAQGGERGEKKEAGDGS